MQFKFNIFLQHLVPQHGLSRLAGWIANCRWHWLKNKLIKDFIRRYQVDLSIATLKQINDYPNFNSFFTRQLSPDARPIAPHDIISPVDGCVSQAGKITQQVLMQAKGHDYNLLDLLGGNTHFAKQFTNGQFATLYLAPKDYHRVHMPLRGALTHSIYIPGKLFSVNEQTTNHVSQLFSRNERLVCLFDTELGPVAIILVGAMLVSGIKTIWPLSLPTKTLSKKEYPPGITLEKGAELGHFTMGSTVILLFPENTMQWSEEMLSGKTVKMGESIAKRL